MFDILSSRENEITALVAEGFSNREIGLRLSITEKTVKFHLTKVYRKLEVNGRFGLVTKALRASFPKPEVSNG